MSRRGKKKSGKVTLTPEKPREAIRKLGQNGFRLVNRDGGDWFYSREKNGKRYLVMVSVHPRELGKPFVKNIIRKSGKTNSEWAEL